MASPALQPEYLKAGEDYLAALRKLGMHPRFLGWGWEIATEHWLLVLVTSILDAGGPLALNKLLFQAYNAEATPKAISPFIVRVFSPEIVPPDFYLLGAKNAQIGEVRDKHGNLKPTPVDSEGRPVRIENMEREFFGIELQMKNSYENIPSPKLGYHDRRAEWQRFKRNVERLAA